MKAGGSGFPNGFKYLLNQLKMKRRKRIIVGKIIRRSKGFQGAVVAGKTELVVEDIAFCVKQMGKPGFGGILFFKQPGLNHFVRDGAGS